MNIDQNLLILFQQKQTVIEEIEKQKCLSYKNHVFKKKKNSILFKNQRKHPSHKILLNFLLSRFNITLGPHILKIERQTQALQTKMWSRKQVFSIPIYKKFA